MGEDEISEDGESGLDLRVRVVRYSTILLLENESLDLCLAVGPTPTLRTTVKV